MNNCTYHLISKLNDLSAQQLKANCIVLGKNQDSFLNPKESVSFEDFIHLIIKSQSFIKKHNFSKLDSIVLLEAPSPELYATIVGALSLGIQIIFIEPWLPVLEIETLLGKLKPKILFCNYLTKKWLQFRGLNLEKISNTIQHHPLAKILYESHKNKNIEILNLADDHPGICTFTSGTSGGKSKGVQRSHQKLINQFEVISKHRPMGDLKHYDYVIFPNLVLNNLSNLKPSLIFQKNKSLHEHKTFLNIPKSCQPDTMAINPGTLKFILENELFFNSFRHIKVGGALLDCWIAQNCIKALPQTNWSHIYGSTEAEPVAIGNLEQCLEESLKKNYFQVLCLGNKINECDHQFKNDQIMWIHGKHVSEFYVENEKANLENKFRY